MGIPVSELENAIKENVVKSKSELKSDEIMCEGDTRGTPVDYLSEIPLYPRPKPDEYDNEVINQYWVERDIAEALIKRGHSSIRSKQKAQVAEEGFIANHVEGIYLRSELLQMDSGEATKLFLEVGVTILEDVQDSVVKEIAVSKKDIKRAWEVAKKDKNEEECLRNTQDNASHLPSDDNWIRKIVLQVLNEQGFMAKSDLPSEGKSDFRLEKYYDLTKKPVAFTVNAPKDMQEEVKARAKQLGITAQELYLRVMGGYLNK